MIETFRTLYRQAGHEDMPVAMRKRASASAPYDAGGTGRRAAGWNTTRLGPSTLLWGNLEQLRSRSRDAIRNNPWASSAIDKFESNVIGTGIQPHWQHPDQKVRTKIQQAWNRWIKASDFAGQIDFYGIQALCAREVFEAGEVFIRYRLRPAKDGLFVPLQLQLIEGEQVPVFLNSQQTGAKNAVRCGIEFDNEGRRVAYHMYKEHPGETMFYSFNALQWVQIPADEIRHVYKPLRIGQLRGEPGLTSVLALLYELDQYSDAELVRKKVSAMFAGFITKPSNEDQIIPPAPTYPFQPGVETPLNSVNPYPDIGTSVSKLEPGTLQQLFPGEEIIFPSVPEASDFASFLNVQLHKFCAGLPGGMTYEQISGDLRGVNYSSIRAGLLEMRRACEQFQFNIIIHQACEPIKNRWLKEAVLCGAVDLGNAYFDDPTQFEDVVWVPPGWQWVDPQKEMAAYQVGVRSGFTSRTMVVREQGFDPEVIDNQQAEERQRALDLGLVYDSDPNKVLIGRETQPTMPTDVDPAGSDEDQISNVPVEPRKRPKPLTPVVKPVQKVQ